MQICMSHHAVVMSSATLYLTFVAVTLTVHTIVTCLPDYPDLWQQPIVSCWPLYHSVTCHKLVNDTAMCRPCPALVLMPSVWLIWSFLRVSAVAPALYTKALSILFTQALQWRFLTVVASWVNGSCSSHGRRHTRMEWLATDIVHLCS